MEQLYYNMKMKITKKCEIYLLKLTVRKMEIALKNSLQRKDM